MLPPAYLRALGARWRGAGYNLRWLAQNFFGSRMFFAPEFRGEFIKSPVQLYLGLVQDMSLDVIPLPRYVINPLRQMGQTLYNPPNVRGWVGGRNWINSTSLAARRTLVETLFHPIREDNLTADERAVVLAARAEHRDFTVGDDRLAPLAGLDPDAVVRSLVGDLLSTPADASFREALRNFIAGAGANPREHQRRVRRDGGRVPGRIHVPPDCLFTTPVRLPKSQTQTNAPESVLRAICSTPITDNLLLPWPPISTPFLPTTRREFFRTRRQAASDFSPSAASRRPSSSTRPSAPPRRPKRTAASWSSSSSPAATTG